MPPPPSFSSDQAPHTARTAPDVGALPNGASCDVDDVGPSPLPPPLAAVPRGLSGCRRRDEVAVADVADVRVATADVRVVVDV